MNKGRFIQTLFAIGAILTLLSGNVCAATTPLVDSTFYSRYPYIRFVSSDEARTIAASAAAKTSTNVATQLSDDAFYTIAARVGFPVNMTEPSPGDQFLSELKSSVLPRINSDSLELVYMIVRGAASPDGPYENNKVLGEKRARWLFDFIRQHLQFPVNEKLFRLDSEAEDYHALCFLMRQAADKDYALVKSLCDTHLPTGDINGLKTALKAAQNGQLWKRLNSNYFFHLRAARVVLYFKKYEGEYLDIAEITAPAVLPPVVEPALPPAPEPIERPAVLPPDTVLPPPVEPAAPSALVSTDLLARREVLAVKTNLLFYGVYMPNYDRWCPIPNVAVEYYPKKGHFTLGASFDMPWWQDYDAHKYFQLRNYQIETRYYLKGANKANKANKANGAYEANGANKAYEANGAGPLYSGFYLQAYGNCGIFGICFDANRGWVGEGFGGGVGAGYVMPLSHNGHWRLELGLQVGFFRCKYDPYQYENPVDPSYKDNLYYYKWTLDPSLFKERQYRWNWIGPTRVGVTLSYDLLYKRINKRGVSFKAYEVYEANGAGAPERRGHE